MVSFGVASAGPAGVGVVSGIGASGLVDGVEDESGLPGALRATQPFPDLRGGRLTTLTVGDVAALADEIQRVLRAVELETEVVGEVPGLLGGEVVNGRTPFRGSQVRLVSP